jgi:hypothetical protein
MLRFLEEFSDHAGMFKGLVSKLNAVGRGADFFLDGGQALAPSRCLRLS